MLPRYARVAARPSVASKEKKKKPSGEEDGAAVIYKAPRLQAVDFDSRAGKSDKAERRRLRNIERMRNSEVMSSLRTEFGDEPELSGVDGIGDGVGGGSRERSRKVREIEVSQRCCLANYIVTSNSSLAA